MAVAARISSALRLFVAILSAAPDNAPMPYQQRLTWKGVAMHAGNLPGFPASHGCVRLPMEFAKKLLTEAHVAVAPGVGFGEEGEGFVRIALVENEQRLRQAARGIKKMLASG